MIHVIIATLMLLGSLAAPYIAARVDQRHVDPVVVSVISTSDGHYRGDCRSASRSHYQQDGIVAQPPEAFYARPETIGFDAIVSVAVAGALEPVEQRPPISSI